jgi:hypothetical protein
MRNDFTPVETCEIDDAELDNVSGGVLGLDPTSALPFGSLPEPVRTVLSTVPGNVPGNVPSL